MTTKQTWTLAEKRDAFHLDRRQCAAPVPILTGGTAEKRRKIAEQAITTLIERGMQ